MLWWFIVKQIKKNKYKDSKINSQNFLKLKTALMQSTKTISWQPYFVLFAPAISWFIVSGGFDMLRRRKNTTGTGRLERNACSDETNAWRLPSKQKTRSKLKLWRTGLISQTKNLRLQKTHVFTVEHSASFRQVFNASRGHSVHRYWSGAPKSEDEVQIPGVFLWPCRCCSARCAGLSLQISDRILLRPTAPPASRWGCRTSRCSLCCSPGSLSGVPYFWQGGLSGSCHLWAVC